MDRAAHPDRGEGGNLDVAGGDELPRCVRMRRYKEIISFRFTVI